MPAAVGEGFHAKGSCEAGQAGRCSHKRRTLVQWECLFSISRGHLILVSIGSHRTYRSHGTYGSHTTAHLSPRRQMAKRKAPAEAPNPAAPPTEYTVVARRYRPQQFADLV